MENKLSTDYCSKAQKQIINDEISNYNTFNFYDGSFDRSEMSRYRDGYGVNGATVSQTRQSELTHGPEKQQLSTRSFKAVPDFGRGCLNMTVTESILKNGLDTSALCKENLAENNFDRFIPLTKCMQNYIAGFGQPQQIGLDTREMWRCASRSNI